MTEYVYVMLGIDSAVDCEADVADLRVSEAAWRRFQTARARYQLAWASLAEHGQRPVVVSPEQEESIRAAARPGTWIVVRAVVSPPEADVLEVVTADVSARASNAPELALVESSAEPPTAEAPAGPATRPSDGPCPTRGGLGHQVDRAILTAELSQWFPPLQRVDGLCRCGQRLYDVRCPHPGQQPGDKVPTCAWCRKVLVANAGFNNNWDQAQGRMTEPPTVITGGGTKEEQQELNKTAPFRAGQ